MAYADYEFYRKNYFGNVVPEADFPRLSERASDWLDTVTFDRLVDGLPSDERTQKRIHDLLDTVYVGSKRRNDDPVVLVLCKNRIKGLADGALRHRKSRTDRVGTVAHQRQHAFLSKLGKTLQIRRFTEYRCVIDLEIAGVDDNTSRGEDRKRRCICDTVVRLDKLNPKTSEIDGLSVFYDLAADGLHHILAIKKTSFLYT